MSQPEGAKQRVLIHVVCYCAEAFVESVLERIPAEVWDNPRYEVEVLVIDDASPDVTFLAAHNYATAHAHLPITVLHNPTNLGYGGNQKLGYHWAIERGFDAVVLLHGDGQYAPEYLPQMIAPILDGQADVVLGSRMLDKQAALDGGMPVYKWLGNQILTGLQNLILRSRLAEFHTGYRAYRVASLAAVPFECNADYFDFDTDILIQMLDTGQRFVEVPIPTFYGTEISRVNGLLYGWRIVLTSLRSRVVRLGILYDARFHYVRGNAVYAGKLGYPSSHEFALQRVAPRSRVLDVGCGPGVVTEALCAKQVHVVAVDREITPLVRQQAERAMECDVDQFDFAAEPDPVDTVLLLDIIEHLREPEAFLARLRRHPSSDEIGQVILTTGNVAFLPVRLSLLLGSFNYGPAGILDLTHTRLFTFASLRRLLRDAGFDVLEETGIPAPFPLVVGHGLLGRLLLAVNGLLIRLSPGLFAYQIALVVRPRPTLDVLLRRAHAGSATRLAERAATPAD